MISVAIVTKYNSNLKLPDGGAKLKAKLEQIKSLLEAQQASESNITDKVSGLSLNDKPDIRRATVLRSSQAEIHAENLLRAHPTQSQSSHVSWIVCPVFVVFDILNYRRAHE